MIKGILIDANKQTVEEIQYKDFRDITKLLECDMFSIGFYLEDNHVVYVDDEGLYTDKKGFVYNEIPNIFIGNALIEHNNKSGHAIDVTISVEELRKKIVFINNENILYEFKQGILR